jgi:Na+-transporting NADH:ubiquinone oxidoreductase subunit C
MKAERIRQGLFTIFFMLATTFIAISGVTMVHLGTRERVDRNAALFRKTAVLEAAGLTVPDNPEAALDLYQRAVEPVPDGEEPRYYRITDPDTGEDRSRVFFRSGAGLWGTIRAAVGLNSSLEQFTGIAFVEQNETPGLGARIEEPWFRAQVAGKTAPLELDPESTRSGDPARLDAITGATVTSKAVRDMLNGTMRDADTLLTLNGQDQAEP